MMLNPFTAGVEPAERTARLRLLRDGTVMKCRNEIDLVPVLKVAQTDDSDFGELEHAFKLLSAFNGSRLLASYCQLLGGAG